MTAVNFGPTVSCALGQRGLLQVSWTPHGTLYGTNTYQSLPGAIAGCSVSTWGLTCLSWDAGADLKGPKLVPCSGSALGLHGHFGSLAWHRVVRKQWARTGVEAWSWVEPVVTWPSKKPCLLWACEKPQLWAGLAGPGGGLWKANATYLCTECLPSSAVFRTSINSSRVCICTHACLHFLRKAFLFKSIFRFTAKLRGSTEICYKPPAPAHAQPSPSSTPPARVVHSLGLEKM